MKGNLKSVGQKVIDLWQKRKWNGEHTLQALSYDESQHEQVSLNIDGKPKTVTTTSRFGSPTKSDPSGTG